MESVVCVLRNLSYQLESEVDLQDGAEDVLDREWEAEQRKDLEEASMGWEDHTPTYRAESISYTFEEFDGILRRNGMYN